MVGRQPAEFLMQMRPLFGKEEKEALASYMDEDGFLTEFRNTTKFENAIAEFTGAKHCVVTNNGTVALTLAALACGIKAGDEVIVPNYTMIATPNSVQLFGAKPVFVDVESESLCLDFDHVKKAVTPKTRAVIFMPANGRAPKRYSIWGLRDFCREKNLILIEDSAQCLGSYYEEVPAEVVVANGNGPTSTVVADSTGGAATLLHMGLVGDCGTLSFSAPKIISTGQGGAVLTNSDDLANKLRKVKDFGRSGGGNDIHGTMGYNFKFTELQAVVGLCQMAKLPDRVKRKKEIAARYRANLAEVCVTPAGADEQGILLFDENPDLTCSWFIDCLVKGPPGTREELMAHLKANKIGTRVMYPPIHSQECYQDWLDEPARSARLPVSEMVGREGLWLPSAVQLTDDEVDIVCEQIREFFQTRKG